MTDKQANHLSDAQTLIAAALTLLSDEVTGDRRALPDMLQAILVKAAEDLDHASAN